MLRVELEARSFAQNLALVPAIALHFAVPLAVITVAMALVAVTLGSPLLELASFVSWAVLDIEWLSDSLSLYVSVLVVAAIGFVIAVLPGSLFTGAATMLLLGAYSDDGAGLSESIVLAIRRFFGLFLVSLAFSLLVGLGLLVLVIPGLMALASYLCVVPAFLVEDSSLGGAFERSAWLTKGRRWQTLGFALVLILLAGAAVLVEHWAIEVVPYELYPAVNLAIIFAVNLVESVLAVVVPVVWYLDLRARREGFRDEHLDKALARLRRPHARRLRVR